MEGTERDTIIGSADMGTMGKRWKGLRGIQLLVVLIWEQWARHGRD